MRRFWSDQKGNVAIIFALVSVPLFGVVGSAVDYGMASAHRADIQKALDATALALTKVMPVDDATLNTYANQYFQANLKEHNLENLQLTIAADIGKLRVSATATYKSTMASIIGAGTIDLGASAEAVWSMGKVEIALVLDMSLSMDAPKIQALRASTTNLLNVLENAAREEGDAKVGIVPFDGMVNVGSTGANPPNWVRFDWWDANVGSCSISINNSNVPAGTWLKNYCQGLTASSCQGASGSSQSQCQSRGGKWVTVNGVWTQTNRSQWAGCVYDRTPSHDVTDTAPTGNSTYYPAAKCHDAPPQAITALTEDWAALRTKATNLTPTGYTNIAIGLAWGWHVLSPGGLFNEGADYGTEDLTKYIILMTDGYNTKNIQMEPGNCNTNGPVCPTVDTRMRMVCDNIKEEDIKIYTIRLIDGNEDLLRECASSASMYYDVQNANQLAGVFNAIGSEIASLHLAK